MDQNEHVLVIDDEDEMRRLVSNIIRDLGYTPVKCASAVEAQDVYNMAPEKILFIISDIKMPGMDGREFISYVRNLRPELPCILMSGWLSESELQFPSVLFLQKPFSSEQLKEMIEVALSGPCNAEDHADLDFTEIVFRGKKYKVSEISKNVVVLIDDNKQTWRVSKNLFEKISNSEE